MLRSPCVPFARFVVLGAALALGGCFDSYRALESRDGGSTGDSGAMGDSGLIPVDPVDGSTLDITACADAPELPIRARFTGVRETGLQHPPAGSCWTSSSSIYGYFHLTLPAHTGVEIVTRGTAPPIASVADGCAPVAAGEDCDHFGPNGYFGPGPTDRSHYVGNPTDVAWSLVVAIWWSDASDWPRAPFEIETIPSSLPAEASCETPARLAEGTLVPGAEGGYYEACGWSENPRFYRITIPAMTRAVPMEGSGPLGAIPRCSDCMGADDLATTLENLSAEPRDVTVTLAQGWDDDSLPIGYRLEEMPETSACESAPELVVDGPTLTVDMDFAGYAAVACDAASVEGAHYVRVTAAAGATIRVRVVFPTVGPEQGTVLWARTACAETTCDAVSDDGALGRGTAEIDLTAPAGAARSWVVGVGMTALPLADQSAELTVVTIAE